MKRLQLGLMGFVAVLFFVPSVVCGAPIITAGIDGHFVDVPVFLETPDDGGNFAIGSAEDPQFIYEINGVGKAVLQGELDPDPSISFALAVTDFGAPSSFSFSYTLPLAPTVSNPSTVFDSLSGSVTNGVTAGGVTVTALAPPAGIPIDADGAAELQVYTLSDDLGVTYKNVGLDAGPTTVVPLGANNSGAYGLFNQGPVSTIAGGPWTHMRVDINFALSGGGDIFTLNGAKTLTPEPGHGPAEPSTALLGALAAALIGLLRPRSARNQ